MSRNLWYLPLEIQASRYTVQLCGKWIPDAFKQIAKNGEQFKMIEGEPVPSQIKVGHVLDATGRGIYSLSQVGNFLHEIEKGNVNNNDILYIQDYWTPGIEAIWYALDLYKIKLKVYSMCHAQSVDEFDFTHQMKEWMRPYELGLDKVSAGIFVGSTIHKKQLRDAGFKSRIHVVSLPLGLDEVKERMKLNEPFEKENSVVYSSRLDWEKQPKFMMKVAAKFLEQHPDWDWYVTTSGKTFRSSISGLVDELLQMDKDIPNFHAQANLSKEEYYDRLKKSKIQFNTSLQDYVSWTLLEANAAGCDFAYPNFRSFPECVSENRLYDHQSEISALTLLDKLTREPIQPHNAHIISDIGRLTEMYIMLNDEIQEADVWKDYKKWEMKVE